MPEGILGIFHGGFLSTLQAYKRFNPVAGLLQESRTLMTYNFNTKKV